MKATELRIGNYIMDTEHPERECRVFRLTCGTDYSIAYSYDKACESSYANDKMDLLQPIPLTEEWLLKFGFIPCIGRISVFEINLRDISNYKALIFYMTNGQVDIDSTQLTYIKYVHQLQNLYFALTGNELTIK